MAFKIHGAYKSKSSAMKKEKKVKGFIIPRKIKGKKRYLVLKKR